MEDEEGDGVSTVVAVTGCTAMTLLYVAILYSPTLIFRLPPPSSFKHFIIRRFICAAVSSVVSIMFCAFILPISSKEVSSLFGVYGIRMDHLWQAVVLPLSLTSLMYAGSIVLKIISLAKAWKEHMNQNEGFSTSCIKIGFQKFHSGLISVASNVSAWRNYVVAPLTEELVFRACMISLLLCGGFRTPSVIFLCPIFFSLAHLNHMMEFYSQKSYSLLKTSMAVGLQLGYTVIFGSYASFLFIRTGHLISPLVAHIFCNFMGLPVLYSRSKGIVGGASVVGLLAFLWLLYPMTSPDLYNYTTNNCRCWEGYCFWN